MNCNTLWRKTWNILRTLIRNKLLSISNARDWIQLLLLTLETIKTFQDLHR